MGLDARRGRRARQRDGVGRVVAPRMRSSSPSTPSTRRPGLRRDHVREGRGGDRACSRPTSATTPGATACAATCAPTPTATRRATTCGGRSTRSRAGRSTRSPTTSRASPACRCCASCRAACEDGRTTLVLTQGEFSLDQPDRAPLAWRIPVVARVAGQAPARALVAGGAGRLAARRLRRGRRQRRPGRLLPHRGTRPSSRPRCSPRSPASRRSTSSACSTTRSRSAWPARRRSPRRSTWSRGCPTTPIPKVWTGVADHLARHRRFYRIEPARRAAWRRFAIARLAPVLARIGWLDRAADESARRRPCCARA